MKGPISIGVTGHRKISNECSKKIHLVLHNLSQDYSIEKVYSPLAEGADREVARFFIDIHNSNKGYGTKLIVPLPFDEKKYIDTFTDTKSKIEFQEMLTHAVDSYIISLNICSDKESINEMYKLVGQHVVEESKIMIVVWDGKRSNGVGGTAETVEYAQKNKKMILHINSDTCEVFKINWTTNE